jgi:hypothetical protein
MASRRRFVLDHSPGNRPSTDPQARSALEVRVMHLSLYPGNISKLPVRVEVRSAQCSSNRYQRTIACGDRCPRGIYGTPAIIASGHAGQRK